VCLCVCSVCACTKVFVGTKVFVACVHARKCERACHTSRKASVTFTRALTPIPHATYSWNAACHKYMRPCQILIVRSAFCGRGVFKTLEFDCEVDFCTPFFDAQAHIFHKTGHKNPSQGMSHIHELMSHTDRTKPLCHRSYTHTNESCRICMSHDTYE